MPRTHLVIDCYCAARYLQFSTYPIKSDFLHLHTVWLILLRLFSMELICIEGFLLFICQDDVPTNITWKWIILSAPLVTGFIMSEGSDVLWDAACSLSVQASCYFLSSVTVQYSLWQKQYRHCGTMMTAIYVQRALQYSFTSRHRNSSLFSSWTTMGIHRALWLKNTSHVTGKPLSRGKCLFYVGWCQ